MEKIVKNKYFWIILILILIYIPIIILLVINSQKKEAKEGYLIISNITSLYCNPKECNPIENEKLLENNKNNIFEVYEENQNIGKYKMDFINNWLFYDTNNNWQNISESFIAANETLQLKVINYNTREMNNNEIKELDKILKKNDISTYSQLEQNVVIEYDFDKDNNLDKIIMVSNATDDSEDEKLFSIIFSIIKNKVEVVEIEIYNQYENLRVPVYNVYGIINLYGNKEDYVIINKGYFSEEGKPSNEIYKFENKKLKSIIKKTK